MKRKRNEPRMFRVSVSVSPTYFVPLFFRDQPASFQWARTQVIPLEKSPGQTQDDKWLDDAIDISYDIPAISAEAAIAQSVTMINFILNIASFHYSVGLTVKSPVSVIDIETGEGISYDFHRIRIGKEELCTKTIDAYFPMTVKDSRKTFKLSSDQILTYEPSEIFKVDDFYQTIDLFRALYFSYIEDPELRQKIEFSLNVLKEAYQIPSFIPRFVLYWRAFEELTDQPAKSGVVSQESLDSIVEILKAQQSPKLSAGDIRRVREQICNIHLESKTDLVVEEMKKYFDESEERLRDIYRRLNKTRQRIIHSDYTGNDVLDLWANTDLLKSIVRQIVKVHFKYPKAKLPEPHWEGILHIREAPKPKLQITRKGKGESRRGK